LFWHESRSLYSYFNQYAFKKNAVHGSAVGLCAGQQRWFYRQLLGTALRGAWGDLSTQRGSNVLSYSLSRGEMELLNLTDKESQYSCQL